MSIPEIVYVPLKVTLPEIIKPLGFAAGGAVTFTELVSIVANVLLHGVINTSFSLISSIIVLK